MCSLFLLKKQQIGMGMGLYPHQPPPPFLTQYLKQGWPPPHAKGIPFPSRQRPKCALSGMLTTGAPL